MGEPADSALSPIEERRLGAAFMRQIRARLPLVRDARVDEYVQGLGERLALAATRDGEGAARGEDFTFFVVDDPQVNAFAIPGGYVGLYVGLIQAMTREEQLAGVVAHEVAHVTQRHHARAFAIGQRSSMSTAATILAAILIGAASPEAGQAALAAGLAASQQRAINFTRANEVEADRIGIEILANADYDPEAMAESFRILRRKNRLNTAGLQLEYLRTHPLDDNRVAEAADRAAALPDRPAAPPLDFQLFKARLLALTAEDRGAMRREFAASRSRAYASYGLATLALGDGDARAARAAIAELLEVAPGHPWTAFAEAELLEVEGEVDAALERAAELDALYPGRYSIVERRLEWLVDTRRLEEAEAVANRYLRDVDSPNPLAWRTLADVRQRTGDPVGSHEALARHFEALDEDELAAGQLELALAQVPVGSQDELRLRAALAAVSSRLERD